MYWNVIYTKYIRRLYIHIHHYYDFGGAKKAEGMGSGGWEGAGGGDCQDRGQEVSSDTKLELVEVINQPD